jgi:hypothetical protein
MATTNYQQLRAQANGTPRSTSCLESQVPSPLLLLIEAANYLDQEKQQQIQQHQQQRLNEQHASLQATRTQTEQSQLLMKQSALVNASLEELALLATRQGKEVGSGTTSTLLKGVSDAVIVSSASTLQATSNPLPIESTPPVDHTLPTSPQQVS